jgi:membrane protein YqaA with SNARE-associated domain
MLLSPRDAHPPHAATPHPRHRLDHCRDTLHDQTEQIIVWIEALISRFPVLGMLVFVLLAMVSAMLAFFSSAVFAPIAIFAWGKTVTLMLLWLGWFLGGIVSYCIGRFLGRSVASMLIGEEKIANWRYQVQGRTRFVHILLFQAAVPSEIPIPALSHGTRDYRITLCLRRRISRGVLPERAEPHLYPAWTGNDFGKCLRLSAVSAACSKILTSSRAETRMHETVRADDTQSSNPFVRADSCSLVS